MTSSPGSSSISLSPASVASLEAVTVLRGSRFSMASNAVMILVVEAMARRSSGFFSKSTRPSSMLIRMPADPVISGAGGSLTAAPTVGGGDCEGAVVIPLGSVVLVVATDTGGSQHAATNTTASKTIRTVARGERAEGRPFAFETIVISIYHECPPAIDGPRASAETTSCAVPCVQPSSEPSRNRGCYTLCLQHLREVREITDILKNTWRRLTGKQFLALYPFILGLINVLAFLAVYSSIEPELSLTGLCGPTSNAGPSYRRTLRNCWHQACRWPSRWSPGWVHACWLQPSARPSSVPSPAAATPGAPQLPRTGTVGRLLRGGLHPLFVVPYSLPADSAAFQAIGIAVIPASLLFVFGDYAVVFEDLGPWAAVKRSVSLLRQAWLPAIIFFLVAMVLWSLLAELYGRYYADGSQIFVLLPLAQLLIEALLTTLLDVLMIMTYQRYRN